VVDVLQPDELPRRRRTLELSLRARVRAAEIRVACVRSWKSQRRVVVEAAQGGGQGALQPGRGKSRRGGGRRGCLEVHEARDAVRDVVLQRGGVAQSRAV